MEARHRLGQHHVHLVSDSEQRTEQYVEWFLVAAFAVMKWVVSRESSGKGGVDEAKYSTLYVGISAIG